MSQMAATPLTILRTLLAAGSTRSLAEVELMLATIGIIAAVSYACTRAVTRPALRMRRLRYEDSEQPRVSELPGLSSRVVREPFGNRW